MGNRGLLVLVATILVIVSVYAVMASEEPDEYVPLLELKSLITSPSTGFDGVITLQDGESVSITVNVKSLSDDYQNNGRIEVSFENEYANQYFEIKENTRELGIIPRQGATSGPIGFTITAIIDPGIYESTVMVKIFIDDNLNDETSFKLKIQ